MPRPRGNVYARAMPTQALTLSLPNGETVSGLWQSPADPAAVLVLAHGAGAGMTHRHMAATADGLEERGVATLRYQFPYMEKGGKEEDTVGRKCLCNALMADIGMPQIQKDGTTEPSLVTIGDDVRSVPRFLRPGMETYSARDVVEVLLGSRAALSAVS